MDTIQAVADSSGTLIDTGFVVGERVIVTAGGEEFDRVVLGPAAQPHAWMVYDGPRWGRRIATEAALWVAHPDHADLRQTVRLSRIERAEVLA